MSGWNCSDNYLNAFRIYCLDAVTGMFRIQQGFRGRVWTCVIYEKSISNKTLIFITKKYQYHFDTLTHINTYPQYLHFYLQIMLTTQQQQKAIGFLLQKKQNSLCADCNGKSPCWASLDFGVFVCMNCSGAHRALGPSITRVKSTKLDMWNRDWLQNMKIGNSVLNEYWENQLVGIARASKPNINTSLSDIIKYVNDKYVKRKYVDPNQPLDPLKRSKLQPQPPKPQPEINQPKQQIAKVVNNNNESPFNAFNTIINNKQKAQRKSSDNLINFQKEVTKKPQVESSNHQTKYNHAQFHTISGSKPKQQQNLINFQSLTKNIQHTHQQPQNTHSNFLINPQSHHYHNNQGHYSTGHYDNHYHQSIPQYDRAQYVTMNINMNMYPKVMNINMNPQNTTNNFLQTPPSNNFANQFLGQSEVNKKPPQNEVKITLDSNINLDSVGRQKKQEAKSWIDQWK